MSEDLRAQGRQIDDNVDDEQADRIGRRRFAKLGLGSEEDESQVGNAEAWYAAVEYIRELETRIHTLESQVTQHSDQLDSLADVTSEKSSKEEKIAACIRLGENLRNPDQTRVTLTIRDIVGATGVSRRYAYDLKDEIAESYSWASKNEDRDGPRSDPEMKQLRHGLVIDYCELPHTDSDGVNKFTTRVNAKGVDV